MHIDDQVCDTYYDVRANHGHFNQNIETGLDIVVKSPIMNRPNGQQCLAQAIMDHNSLQWFNTNAYIAMEHGHTHGLKNRQCPILRLTWFTEPLPDKKIQ